MGDHQPNQKCFGGRGRGVKQVTIYDVSRLAKVSISTVSNAVNRPDKVLSLIHISEPTRPY
mgnify:CR=1 FL=1